MENNLINKKFIQTVRERIPERGKLTKILTELLFIEKEAVYRRLRGEVPFTFSEVVKISNKIGISLDSIAEGSLPLSHSFHIRFMNFSDPNEDDYKMFKDFNENIKSLKLDSDSESGCISSIIPNSLCFNYKYIYKFYLLKWKIYQNENPFGIKFSNIEIPEILISINEEFISNVQQSPCSVYIFDEQIMEYLIKEIKYFYTLRLISDEDLRLIREDLDMFLIDLERYATTGKFDTGQKVYIYISNLHFESTYNYVEGKNYQFTMIRSFSLSDAYSVDPYIFENMKKWTRFLKRTSMLISGCGEVMRIRFFEKQREIINTLKTF
jgi:hypothetical protein